MTPPQTKRPLIIVAEQRVRDREATADLLTGEGYRAVAAATADQALAVIVTRADTSILMACSDLRGTMDSYALARLVETRWPDIGIIVTGSHAPGWEDLPTKAQFITRPLLQQSMLGVVRELLGAPTPI